MHETGRRVYDFSILATYYVHFSRLLFSDNYLYNFIVLRSIEAFLQASIPRDE